MDRLVFIVLAIFWAVAACLKIVDSESNVAIFGYVASRHETLIVSMAEILLSVSMIAKRTRIFSCAVTALIVSAGLISSIMNPLKSCGCLGLSDIRMEFSIGIVLRSVILLLTIRMLLKSLLDRKFDEK